MKQISFDELRELQLEILKRVDNYCNKNGINYSLAYGSLIGAVRHKGYIPWDDDIDIMMPRKDYNAFLKGFNGAYSDLRIVSPETVGSYYAPYANVYSIKTLLQEPHVKHGFSDLGVKIDVFPVDNVPNDFSSYSKILNGFLQLNRWRYYKTISVFNAEGQFSIKSFIKRIISIPISFSSLNGRSHKLIRQLEIESDFVDIIVWPVYPLKRFRKSSIQKTIRVPFESIEVNIAEGYDEILSSIYGSYLELPPVEKRIAKHDFVAYWK